MKYQGTRSLVMGRSARVGRLFVSSSAILWAHHVTLLWNHAMAFTLGACDGNPCMNGGQCVDMGTESNPKQFTCACAEGYTGLTCQKRIDPCGDEPCQNGGICEPRGEHFHCSCTERFKGKLCEQYIRKRNPCLGDPCGAHGICEVVNYDFICQCSPGWHGSRCEFQEEGLVHPQPVIVPAVIEEKSAAKSALVIGEVVLALFVIFVAFLLLFCIHWIRVANRRSQHQAAQTMKQAMGKEVEPTPGWFETSNELCYDFFCFCCKLVNRYENERCRKRLLFGDTDSSACADAKHLECLKQCMRNHSSVAGSRQGTEEKYPEAQSLGAIKGLSGGSRASKAGSKALSRPGSRPSSRPGSVPGSMPGSRPTNEEEEECDGEDPICSAMNLQQNAMDSNSGSGNRSHNSYLGVNHGGIGGGGGGIWHASRGRTRADVYNTRQSRGSLPGFQPCSQFLQDDSGGILGGGSRGGGESGTRRASSNKVRVRRYLPSKSRSDRAIVDILDCDDDDGDDDDDDEGDDDDEDDDGAEDNGGVMVGPGGNIVPMTFRSGMAAGRRRSGGVVGIGGNVDQLDFDSTSYARCLNQSNSFGRDSSSSSRGAGPIDASINSNAAFDASGTASVGGIAAPTCRGNDGQQAILRSNKGRYNRLHYQRCHSDDSAGVYGDWRGGERAIPYNNEADSESEEENRIGFHAGYDRIGEADVDGNDEDEDDDDDNDDDDDDHDDDEVDAGRYGGEDDATHMSNSQRAPTSRAPQPRRTRREHRHRMAVAEDDGYSSTGRISESDAGGRSRDPLSMAAVTRQAQRNFYNRQPPPPQRHRHGFRPQGLHQGQPKITRQEIVDYKRSGAHLDNTGITFSSRPAPVTTAISTPPPLPPGGYDSLSSTSKMAFSQPQQNITISRNSSPFTTTGQELHRHPAFHHHQQQQYHASQNQPRQMSSPHGYQAQPYGQDSSSKDSSFSGRPSSSSHSSRRPRSSLTDWNRMPGETTPASSTHHLPPPPRGQDHHPHHTRIPHQPNQPPRKPKVKGILKKTSAYGGNLIDNSVYNSSRAAVDGSHRSSPNISSCAPRRQPRYMQPRYPPPVYDEFAMYNREVNPQH